jgi:uncharacterized protein YabE (DUF348 family)
LFYHVQKLRLSLSHALWTVRHGLRVAAGILRTRPVAFFLLAFISVVLYGRYITDLNIFVFHDDGKMIVHETYTDDAMTALEEAGIYISDTDFVSFPARPVRGAAEVVIERSHWVHVFYDGRNFSVPTTGETVESVLQRTGFVARSGDIILPSADTRTEDGMEIRVQRTEVSYEYETETIEFQSVTRLNDNLNERTKVVIQEGVNGSREDTYEITKVEGVMVDRVLIKTVVIEPTDEIIERGSIKTVTMRDGTVLNYSRRLECTATAYTTENKTDKINAIGNIARVGTIAVDRDVIPLRSTVYVCGREGTTWEYGIALCEDVGGFRGNHVDLFYDTRDECIQFGKRRCVVYVLD